MIQQLLIEEFKRRIIDESFERILYCLQLLTPQQIWFKPNPVTNPVGNLVLHICGNTRQWIFSGLLGQKDLRKRKQEFILTDLPKEELIRMIQTLRQDILQHLPQLRQTLLEKTYPVQTFQETGVSILIHVIEHTSYHTGQITQLTKLITEQETNYYKSIPLE